MKIVVQKDYPHLQMSIDSLLVKGRKNVVVVNDVRLVSNSEIQTYKDCPRRWWLAWHRGLSLKRESPIGPGATGTRYHAALASLYMPEGEERADPRETLDVIHREVSEAFEVVRDPLTGEPIDVNEYPELLKSFDLERAMVEGYVEWLAETGADAELEVIAPEAYVEVNLSTSSMARLWWHYPTKLIGKIDARVRSRVTGARKFIDHKSVASLFDPMLRLNQQMLHYHVIEDKLTEPGEPRCEGALYNMARKVKRTRASKPPYFARIPIPHNKFELQNYETQLHGVLDKIVRAEDQLQGGYDHHYAAPSRPSRDCSWKCQFFKSGVCGMLDDGSRVEAAIESLYDVRDPLSYYGGREKESE